MNIAKYCPVCKRVFRALSLDYCPFCLEIGYMDLKIPSLGLDPPTPGGLLTRVYDYGEGFLVYGAQSFAIEEL